MTERTGARERLRELRQLLEPDAARAQAIAGLDEMFRSGSAPDPLPEGMLTGTLVTTSIWGPFDSLAGRIAKVWMPWLGKSFEPASMTG